MGLAPEDFVEEVFEVWPDNWAVVQFFASIGPGAWNIGPSGAVGIRPEAFRELRLAMGVSLKDWPPMYRDICVMEQAAVGVLRSKSG